MGMKGGSVIYRFLGDHQRWFILEVSLGIYSLWWGLSVLSPWTDTFASGTAYQYMVGPEWVWGLVFSVLGALRLWALWTRQHNWRRFCSLLGVFRWSVLGVFFWWGNPASATAWLLIWFAVFSGGGYLAGKRCHIDEQGRCNGLADAQLEIQTKAVEELIGDGRREG
jgi:hypothetical protein